jgi:hypothetical protein
VHIFGILATGVLGALFLTQGARMLLWPEIVGRYHFMDRGFFWIRVFGLIPTAFGVLFLTSVTKALAAAF